MVTETDRPLTQGDFMRLSALIQSECGIKMPPYKKPVLEARLKKRLRGLNLGSLSEYCEYVLSPVGMETEFVNMIDAVATNKTDFFREPAQFDYLANRVLPELASEKPILIWSAGCSTGEEPYTIAIVLNEFRQKCSTLAFSILATDISTRALEKAKMAVYDDGRLSPVPPLLRNKYFMRSRDRERGLVRVVPELRSAVKFHRLNLKDEGYAIGEPVDVIFFRNVLIYFDRPTQEKMIRRMCRHLNPGGYLFTGCSETLYGMDIPLVQAAPSIYRKPMGRP